MQLFSRGSPIEKQGSHGSPERHRVSETRRRVSAAGYTMSQPLHHPVEQRKMFSSSNVPELFVGPLVGVCLVMSCCLLHFAKESALRQQLR